MAPQDNRGEPSPAHLRVLDARLATTGHGAACVDRVVAALGDLEALGGELGPAAIVEVVVSSAADKLCRALAERGLVTEPAVPCAGAWLVRVSRRPLPPLADLSELEPPEPMAAVLHASARLGSGEVFAARLPRYPLHLIPELRRREQRFAIAERPDGTAVLLLWAPP